MDRVLLFFELTLFFVIPALFGLLTGFSVRRWAGWSTDWAIAAGSLAFLLCWSGSAILALPRDYYYAAEFLLAAVIGAFTSAGMRRQSKSRIRWAVFGGVIAFGVVVALTFPIETHAVKLEMPRP
jgi:hypothetical protein